LGSGVSATSVNELGESPLLWEQLLEGARELVATQDMTFIDRMMSEKNHLMALQAIYDKCDSGRYSTYLKQVYSRPNYQASNAHRIIKDIDAKIVITTNFDKIYENLCNDHGYTVAEYTNTKKILSNIKSPESLIIKAHGAIDDTDSLVFTREQYYNARRTSPEFYDILRALFITNTVLFIGYSLNDPDINLVLDSIANSSSPSCPHYVIVKTGIDKEVISHWKQSYNISCLEYGPEYQNLEENLEQLRDLVLEFRAKRGLP